MIQEILMNFISPVFYQVLYMTIIGSIVGILVYLIRNIFDKKMSGKSKCVLWSIVLITLLIPVRFEVKSDYAILENNFVDRVEDIKYISNYEYNGNAEILSNNDILNDNSKEQLNKTEQTENNLDEENTYKMPLEIKIRNIVIPAIWLIGCVLLILTFCNTTKSIRKKTSKKIYKDERIESILNQCKNQLNIKSNVSIVLQKYKRVPSIFGILNPSILITKELLQEDDQTIKYIFLHELSHYKRKDMLLNYILLLVLSVHWFNPIIWFLFNKIRQDIEIGADELASKGLTKAEKKEYGMVLINSLRNQAEENYATNLLCMSDTGKNMERRIVMLKGKSKSIFFSMVIITVILAVVVSIVFIKKQTIEDTNSVQNTVINNIQENNLVEVSNEEKAEIENYINEICNDYFGLGRLPLFDRIENADKNWIYGHIKAEETMPNPTFEYEYISAYASKESIENNLKKLFGENYDINLERDNEYLENNMYKFDEQVGKYERIPIGDLLSICYFINTIKKENETYTVNVLESVVTSDYDGKYGYEMNYSLIETFKDYDQTKALIENGKEIFHIKSSEIHSNNPHENWAINLEVLKPMVLQRKNEFLAYNITIKKAENGNLIVQKVESAEVNN